MKIVLLFLFSGFIFIGNAQQIFEKEKLIDSIPVVENTDETFTLYLPSTYNNKVASPIIFIFEPLARGKIGVGSFIQAAEKYNCILISSNTVKNGPFKQNFEPINRIFDYAFSKFNIDDKRVYLAGFSGGSRLATTVAVITGKIAGVIGCGAGFSQEQKYKPSIQEFSYAGICGDRDMNYHEMNKDKSYLKRFNFNSTLFSFDGNHRWPPPQELVKVMDWLAIQAHKKGIAKRTTAQLQKSYVDSYNEAVKSEKENQLLLAAEYYERTVNTYQSFFAIDSVKNHYENLQKNKQYKKLLKSREKAFVTEDQLMTKFYRQFMEDYENPEQSNLLWWNKELDKVLKTPVHTVETEKMIKRLRHNVFVMAYTINKTNSNESTNAQKEYCKDIMKIIYPNRFE